MTEETKMLCDLHRSQFPFVVSGQLLDAILCDDPPRSAYELTRARVEAAFAKDCASKEKSLSLAVKLADAARPVNWRDSLRAHMELARLLFAWGKWAECSAEVETSASILSKHFVNSGPAGMAMAELHAVRGFCLAAMGKQNESEDELASVARLLSPKG